MFLFMSFLCFLGNSLNLCGSDFHVSVQVEWRVKARFFATSESLEGRDATEGWRKKPLLPLGRRPNGALGGEAGKGKSVWSPRPGSDWA